MNEEDCLEKYRNSSLPETFCGAAWDSFICWPPLSAGQALAHPCPQMDAKGMVIGDTPHTDMFAVRICAENGSWIENRTNFTLCMDNMATLHPRPWTPTVVAWIVIVGSILSILTLSITLFIFFYFNACLKCSRLRVHRNLSLALLLNLTLLIVTSSPVLVDLSYRRIEWLCRTVLSLQLYSGQASINWMFVEGLLLHSRVTVRIFERDAPFRLYYAIGWGAPAVLVGCWCWVMTLYHDTPCWSGYGDLPFIWIITGPMLAALLVNCAFLVDIVRVLATKRQLEVESNNACDAEIPHKYCPWPHTRPTHISTCGRRKAVKATALLFPLLGMPHLLFCINPKDSGALEEAYMISNALVKSLQGLFVSVLYCFMNNDVQTALRKAYMRAAMRRNATPRCPNRSGRGLSQTSGTYLSHSVDDGRIFRAGRTVLRLQDVADRTLRSPDCMTVIF